MSLNENPMSTVLRLIDNRIVVVKDNQARAKIKCSEENIDRELLKDYDAQITAALMPNTQVQRLSLNGKLRRRIPLIKVTAFSMNKEMSTADPGKKMRDKLTEQILAIIQECRAIPFETTYNFYGLGYPEGTPHKALDAVAVSDLAPSSATWAELSAPNYQKVWSNDDVMHSKATSTAGQYPEMLFRFKIGKKDNFDLQPLETCVKSIVLTFVGYGLAAAGNGVTFQVWNHTTSAWANAQSSSGAAKETLTITLAVPLTDYIDADGYCWVMARTKNPSAGAATTLYCDFVQAFIQVKGLSHIDVESYGHSDDLSVKPVLFKAEFILRGWLFENIT